MTNFEGINAKIRRARDQINSLKSDMDRFCEDIQQSIVHEVCQDADEQVWVFRDAPPNVPIEWSVRLGEILYNLRSALDHLVWQLVLANGQNPGRHNAFPIVNKQCNWQGATSQLKDVTPEVEIMIKRLQPYTGGIGFPFDVSAFWKLNSLCNIDKHRYLHLVAIVPDVDGISYEKPDGSPSLQGHSHAGKIKENKVLLCFNNAAATINPTFQIDVRFEDVQDPEITAGTVPVILYECLAAVRGAVQLLTKGTAEHETTFR